MLRWMLLAAALIAVAAPGRAEDELSADATREYLLDEVPNFPAVLRDQWSATVPAGPFDADRGNFGMLGDAAAPRPITLKECIALALEHNTNLRVAKLTPVSAANAVRQAYAQFDPAAFAESDKFRNNLPVSTISAFTNDNSNEVYDQTVNWNAGLGKRLLTGGALSAEWTNQRISSNPNVVNQLVPAYLSGLNLSLNQPLLRDFGWRFALLVVDAAQINEAASLHQYEAAVATLVENVERAYWAYVLAIESVRVEVRGLELAKELLRQNEGRFNVGALPRTAVLESEAEVARREAQLVRSRAFERIARDNLRALINARDDATDQLLMIEPADRPGIMATDLDLDQSLRTASEQRPELLAARLNLDSSRVERKIAENQLLPRLDFVGSVGLAGLGGDDANVPPNQIGVPNPQVLGGYSRSLELLTDGRYYQFLVGARLEVPIANAGAKAQFAQAKINAESARLQLQQLEEDVTREITQALNNVKAAMTAIEATRVARSLAEENVRNQQARYDVGLATTKDLIDFQERLTQAERSEVDALITYNIERTRLLFSEGTLLASRNVAIEHAVREGTPWWARF